MLRKYLRQHAISQDLTVHVTRYLTIAVSRQRAFIQEDQVHVLALLSAPLRMKLRNELFAKQLVGHRVIAAMNKRSSGVINMLCYSAVEEERLSSGDVLFHCGELAKKMFFVAEGKLAYLRETHDMVSLYPGQWCSEIILWCPWVHRGDMHARTDCTVLALDSLKFRQVILSFPADSDLPRRYAKELCKRLTQQSSNSAGSVSDIQSLELDIGEIMGLVRRGEEEKDSDEDDDIFPTNLAASEGLPVATLQLKSVTSSGLQSTASNQVAPGPPDLIAM